MAQVSSVNIMNFYEWTQVFRIHHWLKNLLLFVPLLASHQLGDINSWIYLLVAFFSFSFCASAVYIINDLLDIEYDKAHPNKCQRPFAAGRASPNMGCWLAGGILVLSFGLAQWVGRSFLSWLVLYFMLTCTYSIKFKHIMLLDCIILAILYTVRVLSGAAASHINVSFWLLAFSLFFFLSLAFVKRYAELSLMILKGQEEIKARGYHVADTSLVQIWGIASGFAAVLILVLYVNSLQVIDLYRAPQCIWATVPVLLFWVNWLWLQAHHGKMHNDPLVFAIKDKVSWLSGGIFLIILIASAQGFSW